MGIWVGGRGWTGIRVKNVRVGAKVGVVRKGPQKLEKAENGLSPEPVGI